MEKNMEKNIYVCVCVCVCVCVYTHTHIYELLCCTPETNNIVNQLYLKKKKNGDLSPKTVKLGSWDSMLDFKASSLFHQRTAPTSPSWDQNPQAQAPSLTLPFPS